MRHVVRGSVSIRPVGLFHPQSPKILVAPLISVASACRATLLLDGRSQAVWTHKYLLPCGVRSTIYYLTDYDQWVIV